MIAPGVWRLNNRVPARYSIAEVDVLLQGVARHVLIETFLLEHLPAEGHAEPPCRFGCHDVARFADVFTPEARLHGGMPVSVAAPQAESDVPQHRERGLVPRRLIRSGQDPSDLRSVPIEFLE